MTEFGNRGLARIVSSVTAVALVAGLTYALLRGGPAMGAFTALGYPGIFLLMAVSESTMVLPGPGFAAVVAAGAVGIPLLVGTVARIGSATGELTGYAAGKSGSNLVARYRGHTVGRRLANALTRYGVVAIVVLAFVPNPAVDPVGVLAASLGSPLPHFWAGCALRKVLRYVLVAYLGAASVASLG